MFGKPKPKKIRRNRFKKGTPRHPRRWLGRLLVGLKLTLLMVVLLTFSALFMVGYAAVTQAEYFSTRTIKVTGQQRLTKAQILDQADIRPGDNLLALNLRMVRERLMAHPWVATAAVSREIPGTLEIRIKEHQPLARIDLGRRFLINVRGRIFKEVGPDDPEQLPLVSGIAYGDISLGDDALTPAVAAVVEVLKMSQAPGSAIPYSAIAGLHMDKEMGISLTLKENDRLIKLGFDHYEAKYQRYRQLCRHLMRNSAWHDFKGVDLNNPDRVVVRLG